MMLTVKDAARTLGVDPQTVRRYLPLQRLGRRVLVQRADVLKLAGRPSGRTMAWDAMRVWIVNEHKALCDDKADLLASTASAFMIENLNGDITSDAFVAYAFIHQPLGGGIIGDQLRQDIRREAHLRQITDK